MEGKIIVLFHCVLSWKWSVKLIDKWEGSIAGTIGLWSGKCSYCDFMWRGGSVEIVCVCASSVYLEMIMNVK